MTTENIGTRTVQDAKDRVALAKKGSLADDPTLEYLEALQSEIHGWLDCIRPEVDKCRAWREFKDNFDWSQKVAKDLVEFLSDTCPSANGGGPTTFDTKLIASHLVTLRLIDKAVTSPEVVIEYLKMIAAPYCKLSRKDAHRFISTITW